MLKTSKDLVFQVRCMDLLCLDEAGEVIRPSIIWCDQRTEKECEEITEKVGAKRLIEITANPALNRFYCF